MIVFVLFVVAEASHLTLHSQHWPYAVMMSGVCVFMFLVILAQ